MGLMFNSQVAWVLSNNTEFEVMPMNMRIGSPSIHGTHSRHSYASFTKLAHSIVQSTSDYYFEV